MAVIVNPPPSWPANEHGCPGRPRYEKILDRPSGVQRHVGISGSPSLTHQGPWGHQANPNTRSPSNIIIILKTNPPSQWMAWRRRKEHLCCEPLGVPDRCAPLPPPPPAANEDPSFSSARTRIDEDSGEHSDRQGKAVNLFQACNLS